MGSDDFVWGPFAAVMSRSAVRLTCRLREEARGDIARTVEYTNNFYPSSTDAIENHVPADQHGAQIRSQIASQAIARRPDNQRFGTTYDRFDHRLCDSI